MWKSVALCVVVTACTSDSCPVSIASYCASSSCPATWDAAHDPASWGDLCTTRIMLSTCADVRVATLAGVDTGTQYMYDAHGKLYRIEHYSANFGGSQQCEAGGGDAKVCNDPSPAFVCGSP